MFMMQVMNHLPVFFTLMSCIGKSHAFYKQEEVFLFRKYVLEMHWIFRKAT